MKHIFITGSTDGIGKLAATNLVAQGHSVYIHGRNPQKVAAVLQEIKQTYPQAQVEGFVADLSTTKAVRTLANEVLSKVPQLDVLINNAGVFKSPKTLTSEGLDLRLMVNYIAPYLLTNELLPLLKKQAGSRIINLSSAAQASVTAAVLKGKQTKGANETYAQSKLALTMWSFELAKKYHELNVIAVNPGSLLNTNMALEAYGQYWSSADKGANILLELATERKYENTSGEFFDNDKGSFGRAHSDAYDQEKVNELISMTEEIISETK